MIRQILATAIVILIGLIPHNCHSQEKTILDAPYSTIFAIVQQDSIFASQQTFADATPKIPLKNIWKKFKKASRKGHFDIQKFVECYFEIPEPATSSFTSDQSLPTEEHIEKILVQLTKKIEAKGAITIPLPYPHVMQTGTADCYDYAGDYFTMVGLAATGKIELVKNMVDNYASIINEYGYVPYGNRSYQQSHSQAPYFSLMVRLLAKKDTAVMLEDYLIPMEKEYGFWMSESEMLSNLESARKRVVLMPHGEIMNRYWDDNQTPRPEHYANDIYLSSKATYDSLSVFQGIRAANESGWEFSSRWLGYTQSFATLSPMELIPVDLNCLLYHLEFTLAEAYQHQDDGDKYQSFAIAADYRKNAINKYCWVEEESFFVDYSFVDQFHSGIISLSGLYPLFFDIATADQILPIVEKLETEFLQEGGLTTSLKETGQLWDAPNGYAPLQFIAIKGLRNYDYSGLADDIVYRWITLNDDVFKKTGKLLDKYNVMGADKQPAGGAYPYQDGYGWTIGVYMWLLSGGE